MSLSKSDIELQIKLLFKEWVELNNSEYRNKIRYSGPLFESQEYSALLDAIFNDWWSGGKFTVQAERDLAKFSERNYGLLTNSGSSANLLLMSAAKELYFKDGDKILTLACGFPTTVSPIIQCRLIPKLVDLDLDTLNLDPGLLEFHLNKDRSIKGVFVAHTLGFYSDIDAILNIARKHNIQVFFDNCDAYGSTYNTIPIQHYGKAATMSFYAAHHMSAAGEGGGVVTNDDELQNTMRSFRNWGRYCASPNCCIRSLHPDAFCPTSKLTKDTELPKDYIVNYQYEVLGYNLKPLEIQAAVLIEQIKKIPDFNVIRKSNYMKLYNKFKSYSGLFKIWELKEGVSPFGFPVLIKDAAPFSRKHLVDFMQQNNIETRMLFGGNLTKHPAFIKNASYWESDSSLINSDTIMNKFVMFGVSQVLNSAKIDFIIDKLDEFVSRWNYA